MAAVVGYFVAVSGSDAGAGPLVASPAAIGRIAGAITDAPLAAFDLEFLSAERLVPALCLVQVAWLPRGAALTATPEVGLLDPLAADVGPVIAALAAHPLVVAHAARQDLQLLATRFGARFPGLVDTQVMAAFAGIAGISDQVGLATLVGELVGLTLGKEQQWTDWSRRPLSAAQLAYADADVRHLPRIYALLAERMGDRVAWVREESAVVSADAIAAAEVTPESAWAQVSGTRGLDGPTMTAVVALAAWRQRTASELDRPLGQVLGDKQLLELARVRPREPEGVRGVKGIAPLARQRAAAILEALAAAATAPAAAAPARGWRGPPAARAQRWSELLLAIVQVVAAQTGVAARHLATRADAEAFARAVDERGPDGAADHAALTSWRRAILGEPWRAFLTGHTAVVGDASTPTGLALVPVSR